MLYQIKYVYCCWTTKIPSDILWQNKYLCESIYIVKCFGLWNMNFIDTNQMHISKKNISLEGMGSPTN